MEGSTEEESTRAKTTTVWCGEPGEASGIPSGTPPWRCVHSTLWMAWEAELNLRPEGKATLSHNSSSSYKSWCHWFCCIVGSLMEHIGVFSTFQYIGYRRSFLLAILLGLINTLHYCQYNDNKTSIWIWRELVPWLCFSTSRLIFAIKNYTAGKLYITYLAIKVLKKQSVLLE